MIYKSSTLSLSTKVIPTQIQFWWNVVFHALCSCAGNEIRVVQVSPRFRVESTYSYLTVTTGRKEEESESFVVQKEMNRVTEVYSPLIFSEHGSIFFTEHQLFHHREAERRQETQIPTKTIEIGRSQMSSGNRPCRIIVDFNP